MKHSNAETKHVPRLLKLKGNGVTEQEALYKFCKKMAHRYKSTQEYEDLVSEGYIAALESLAEGGTEEQATSAARGAMRDYMTSLNTPVDIPHSGETRRIVGAIRRGDDLAKYSSVLVNALVNTQEQVQPNTLRSDTTLEEEYIKQELENNLKYILYFWLTHAESYLIHKLFFEEVSPQELADELGVSRQYLYIRRDEVLWKLKKYLLQGKSD